MSSGISLGKRSYRKVEFGRDEALLALRLALRLSVLARPKRQCFQHDEARSGSRGHPVSRIRSDSLLYPFRISCIPPLCVQMNA